MFRLFEFIFKLKYNAFKCCHGTCFTYEVFLLTYVNINLTVKKYVREQRCQNNGNWTLMLMYYSSEYQDIINL